MALPPHKKRSDKQVRIRLAEREDMEALFALDQTCFPPGIAYSKSELQYFLFHRGSTSLVAEDEDGIAGFAIVEFLLEEGRRIAHIVTIDVPPARRRQRVGHLLMDTMMEICCESRAKLIRLEVAVDNEAALAFYRLLGFVETGRIRGFYLGKLDALQMERSSG
jgi:[ribosomal protein S18]-alanine N-acetyltransferase